ncbi:MAG: hypothetical protein LBB54_03700, partial [Cellulomonadaceae bacterium]|nr:hypothetical protein [Cellulomonadaceae bacterium]
MTIAEINSPDAARQLLTDLVGFAAYVRLSIFYRVAALAWQAPTLKLTQRIARRAAHIEAQHEGLLAIAAPPAVPLWMQASGESTDGTFGVEAMEPFVGSLAAIAADTVGTWHE